MVCPAKQEQMEREVAYYLGVVKNAFESGELEEDVVGNVDETHIVVNMDNGRTLAFAGHGDIKYADVSSAGQGMTMMVRIMGGRDASIQPPSLFFKTKKRSFPVQGVPDDIPGVSYITGPKRWMDQKVCTEWLSEPRAIRKDVYGRHKVIFLDNCSCHLDTEAQRIMLAPINASLKVLPKNFNSPLSAS